jgi:hypothetical protein
LHFRLERRIKRIRGLTAKLDPINQLQTLRIAISVQLGLHTLPISCAWICKNAKRRATGLTSWDFRSDSRTGLRPTVVIPGCIIFLSYSTTLLNNNDPIKLNPDSPFCQIQRKPQQRNFCFSALTLDDKYQKVFNFLMARQSAKRVISRPLYIQIKRSISVQPPVT